MRIELEAGDNSGHGRLALLLKTFNGNIVYVVVQRTRKDEMGLDSLKDDAPYY